MKRIIKEFSDGSSLFFDAGKFDDWCVYLQYPDNQRFAPSDLVYFTRLQALGEEYGYKKIYADFVLVYQLTATTIEHKVLDLIYRLSGMYNNDNQEIELLLTVLYAGMVAEENKKMAVLKKRIKRLGMHQLLIEQADPKIAANFSKGKSWRELDAICKSYGF